MLKKILIILIVGIFITSIISVSSISDQYVDAGSRKKIHFTQTISSFQDPGLGHENHQLAFILSPNEGTLYDGSMTFTSSEYVNIVVLHEINQNDVRGQDTWNVNENTVYGLSLIDPEKKSGSFEFTGAGLALHSSNSKEFTTTVSVDGWIRGQPTQVLAQKFEFEKEKPSLLLSDETMAGLSSSEVDEVLDILFALNERGVAVIMIEHIMRAVMKYSERIVVLDAGKKIADGSPDEIVNNRDVERAYLGE